jgi:hypothetical protein
MISRAFRFHAAVAGCLAALLTAASASAKITWNLQPSGAGAYDWTLQQHWYFDTLGPTQTDPSYHLLGEDVGLPGNEGGDVAWPGFAGECLEITTLPGLYTSNPDTRIWVYSNNTATWLSVNDDFGGTVQSHARIWIGAQPAGAGTLVFNIKVAAYGYWDNSQDFVNTITRRDITEAACTTNQTTIPWAQVVINQGQTSVTLSPNAG